MREKNIFCRDLPPVSKSKIKMRFFQTGEGYATTIVLLSKVLLKIFFYVRVFPHGSHDIKKAGSAFASPAIGNRFLMPALGVSSHN